MKNSNELLGKYSLVDGRLDIDFQRESCLNKDKDWRKGGKGRRNILERKKNFQN